jgi:hypothetical protein
MDDAIRIQIERQRAADNLEAAIIVQRTLPSPENEDYLRAAGERYAAAFRAEQTGSYQERTR